MAVICPGCGQQFDVTLFTFDRSVVCDCGRVIRGPQHTIELNPTRRDRLDERSSLMEELKRKAQRICILILKSDFPEVDVAIERSRLREWCEEVFPDRMDLYDMIYESRFDRLLEQFGDDRYRKEF